MHTTEYFSALKRKEILTYATTWVNLEDIKLSEINQTPVRTVWFHLDEVLRTAHLIEVESRMNFTRVWEEQEWEVSI